MKMIGLSGSLKKHSIHTALLHAVQGYLPDTCDFEIVSVDLPLYNEDLEGGELPEPVASLRQKIQASGAIVIASPEFNHSVSGPLKNAIDWASRPAFNSPLKNKPIALMSASPSPVGGARGQAHLRTILSSTISEVYPGIEFLVGNSNEAFDRDRLVDETANRRLQRFVDNFLQWSCRVAGNNPDLY